MEDVRTKIEANIASDYHLILDKIKSKRRKHSTTWEISLQTISTVFLRDTDKLNKFKMALNNKFQILQDLLKE